MKGYAKSENSPDDIFVLTWYFEDLWNFWKAKKF